MAKGEGLLNLARETRSALLVKAKTHRLRDEFKQAADLYTAAYELEETIASLEEAIAEGSEQGN